VIGVATLVVVNVADDSRSDPRLSFGPPDLTDPVTVTVDDGNAGLRLESGRDYIIEMPPEPLDVPGGLRISGGDDVVLIGGEIRFSRWYEGDPGKANRGLYLNGQTGTVHVEGLRIGGMVGEGIDISIPAEGATVQLANVEVDLVTGSRDANHADVVQTWAGPDRLRVDGLSATTTYQGLFLLPDQHAVTDPEEWSLRRVSIRGAEGAGYLLWLDSDEPFPVEVDDVWLESFDGRPPSELMWWDGSAEHDPWSGVDGGDGATVRTGPGTAGLDYTSPGYRS
jgi:hypothetical protein